MPNYKVIQDEKKLKEFIDWLPDLSDHEEYYLGLVARKKYVDGSNNTPMLRRFTSKKESMFNKIRQLECPVGSYVDREGNVIPQGMLALYIMPNPRSIKKAFYASIQTLVAEIAKNSWRDPKSVSLNTIATSKSASVFAHIDVDSGDVNIEPEYMVGKVVKAVGEKAANVIRTRGGYHILIQPHFVISEVKNWYPAVKKSIGEMFIDQEGDMSCPVVGCTQGDFVPHFVHQGGVGYNPLMV